MKLEKTLYSWPHIGLRNTKKISSTELHKWSENMVNVENCNFLKVSCNFQSLVWVKWKQSVCSISFLYSTTFYIFFLPFVVLKIFKFKYRKFFVRHSASISKFEWSEQPCCNEAFWKNDKRYIKLLNIFAENLCFGCLNRHGIYLWNLITVNQNSMKFQTINNLLFSKVMYR